MMAPPHESVDLGEMVLPKDEGGQDARVSYVEMAQRRLGAHKMLRRAEIGLQGPVLSEKVSDIELRNRVVGHVDLAAGQ